ncbi:Chitin bind 4 domain containing protein [Asbolus verrucosus]|uniref:Chitin bind 4 domain containing protein n=1 Tax=Asbolus verrucosus TaxID=1661398 RepID=A0A482VDL3_ASBVE|nr:Chitin bind 4 domain containing protein [Asbolus verrucosus]
MDTLKIIGISLALISPALCQNYGQGGGEGQYQDQYNYNRQPPPQILTHKQALNHDGNFKYVFTSENGLAQGETIAPDGSRNGGYSYVDPTGRKISVKYTAGKEGFRILEADHLPKAPQPLAPVPGVQPQAYTAPHVQDNGQYRPELYARPQQQFVHAGAYAQRGYQPGPGPISNAIGGEIREPEYNDEPGKPHSFGNGYVFEFGG